MHIGTIVKHLRKSNNMTQKELGDLLGVGKSTIQKYENGTIRNLSIETVRILCEHFHVFPWIFVYAEDYLSYLYGDTKLPVTESHFTTYYPSVIDVEFHRMYGMLLPAAREKLWDYAADLVKIPEYVNPLTKKKD